jgi:hypothetical protein
LTAVKLLAVTEAMETGSILRLLPTVDGMEQKRRHPHMKVPMPGDVVESRLPDGSRRTAVIEVFGLELTEVDGELFSATDPSDFQLTLRLRELKAAEVPPGTEVWIEEEFVRPGVSDDQQ